MGNNNDTMMPSQLAAEGDCRGGKDPEPTSAADEHDGEDYHASMLTKSWYFSNGLWRNGYQDAMALNMAIRNGDLALLYRLLSDGADSNLVHENGKTPLFSAIEKLLSLPEGPDSTAEASKTHLFRPVFQEMINLLLFYGADPNIECNSLYPIDEAVDAGHDDLVLCLLQNGSTTATRHPYPPLSRAIVHHRYPMIVYLLRHGADPNAIVPRGDRMLHIAASHSRAPVIQLLLNYGARIHSPGHQGKTPLHKAAENSMWGFEVASVLLYNGAWLEYRGKKLGFTPLGYAFLKRNWDLAWTLLRFDPDIQTRACFRDAPDPVFARPGSMATELLRRKGINVLGWLSTGVPTHVVLSLCNL